MGELIKRTKHSYFFKRFAWFIVALLCLSVLVASQISFQSDITASNIEVAASGTIDSLPTVSYEGVDWSLESVRLSPPSETGVVTLIAEIKLVSTVKGVDLRIPKSSVSLVDARNRSVNLHRFANNGSTQFVNISSGEVKHITLPFKMPGRNIQFKDWSIRLQDHPSKVPALLPLNGKPLPSVSEVGYIDNEKAPVRVGPLLITADDIILRYDYKSNRARVGQKFVYFNLIVDGPEDSPNVHLQNEFWSLRVNGQTLSPLGVSSNIVKEGALVTVAFRAPEEINDMKLIANSKGANQTWFEAEIEAIS